MTAKELGQQPAFPVVQKWVTDVHNPGDGDPVPNRDYSGVTKSVPGLTKREQFAMTAMQALVTNGDIPASKAEVSRVAVEYAESLLVELAKGMP